MIYKYIEQVKNFPVLISLKNSKLGSTIKVNNEIISIDNKKIIYSKADLDKYKIIEKYLLIEDKIEEKQEIEEKENLIIKEDNQEKQKDTKVKKKKTNKK